METLLSVCQGHSGYKTCSVLSSRLDAIGQALSVVFTECAHLKEKRELGVFNAGPHGYFKRSQNPRG